MQTHFPSISFQKIRVFLGGSFDPIHLGHQTMAKVVYTKLQQTFPKTPIILSFLPTAGNPLKSAPTSVNHRLSMLNLAVENTPFVVDSLEVYQKPPVFTIDTVKQLKKCYVDDWLIFIVGQDSLASFDRWKDNKDILNYVQFWAFKRNANQVADRLKNQLTNDFSEFSQHFDKIFWDDTPIPDISSSQIRQYLSQSPKLAKPFLLPSVLDYIKTHQLYQTML